MVNIETIENLFYECPNVKEIWCAVEMSLSRFNFLIALDKIGVQFGKSNNNNVHKVHNLLTLAVKQFNYACKCKTLPIFDMSVSFTLITNRSIDNLLKSIYF